MNNNVPTLYKDADQCIKCNSQMIHLNSIRYCQYCKECPIIIEEQLKVVPRNYRPNGAQNKLAYLIKIQEYLRDFLNRLNIPENQFMINQLIQTVSSLHKSRGQRCKGYREESAAVLYCYYDNEHKLTIRRFCEKNNLELKKFNKMYLAYKKYQKELKEVHVQTNEKQVKLNSNVKDEEEEDENYVKLEYVKKEEGEIKYENQRQRERQQALKRRKNLIQATISKIYDKIFERPYFQVIKNDFKKSLVSKVVRIDGQLLANEQFRTIKQYYKIPCTIFGVIKANGYNISMKKYAQIAENILNIELRDKLLSRYLKQIKIIIGKWQCQQQTFSESNLTGSNG